MLPRRSIVLLAAIALPVAARAQTADSVLFRHGQWGSEFSIGGGFAAVGAIRFSSPTRALVVDLLTGYGHSSFETASSNGHNDNAGARVRLGTRWYKPMARRIYRLATVGASASYNWGHTVVRDTTQGTSQAIGVGLFADLGASWLVTPNLGLGARWGIAVNYTHSWASSSTIGSYSGNSLDVSAGSVALMGQLYF